MSRFDLGNMTPVQSMTRRQALQGAAGAGFALTAGGLLAACGSTTQTGASSASSAHAGKGGELRVGTTGGGATDTLDAHISKTADPDQARMLQLYEPLAVRDRNFQLRMALAESIEPDGNDLRSWTIRLRPDVTFHNGRPLTADDVVFTLRRIVTSPGAVGASGLSYVDPKGLKGLDQRTVQVKMTRPSATFVDDLGQYYNGVVPVGYDPKRPVGTGPFVYESFSPGERSRFTAFADYRGGRPLLDAITIIDFADDSSRVNALLGGQVDAISNLPTAQLASVEGNGQLRALIAPTGAFQPFVMRTNTPPFDDVRVRQAFRLIVNREQMIEQALSGQGKIGNDVFSPYDELYDSSLPQREQDIEQAKSLLKAAGQEGLTVELTTSPVAQGITEAAQVFAQQASEAGVEVKIHKVDQSTFYGPEFLSWPFSQDVWSTHSYLTQVAASSLPSSPYKETQFSNRRYQSLIDQATREPDEGKRGDLVAEAQKIEYDEGGYVIWSFSNQVDACSSKVAGIETAKSGIPLGNYDFREVGFAR